MTAALNGGSISGWLTVLAIVCVAAGGAWFFRRGGGSTALASIVLANQILEKRVLVLEAQTLADGKLIAELKARTDLSVQLHPLVAWTGQHETADQERFDKTIAVLDGIADKLSTSTPDVLRLLAERLYVLEKIADRLDPTDIKPAEKGTA